MAEILPFVRPGAALVAIPRTVHAKPRHTLHGVQRRRFMDFDELVERIGLDCYDDQRTILDRLRLLHDEAGMPAPFLPRKHGGRLLYGAAAIWAGARWERGRVLMWLDQPIGPDDDAGGAALPPADDVGDLAHAEIERLMDRARGMCARRAGA